MAAQDHPVYGEITGPIVMIGFGSIGRGTRVDPDAVAQHEPPC